MGTFAATVANDYKVVDDTENVVFVSKGGPNGSDTTATLTKVDFHEYTLKEIAASDGMLTVKMRRCSLPHNQMLAAGVAPKDGDRVTRSSDSTNWRIIDPITLDDFSISYVCNLSQEK